MKEIDFSNSIEVQEHFDKILKSMQGIKVVSVFSRCPSFSNHGNVRMYMENTEIYILFENEKCFVIFYPFIDALSIDLRPLTEEEKAWYDTLTLKDYFNDSTDIYNIMPDNQTVLDRNQKISLEYDSLERIGLEYVTSSYAKWVDGSLVDEVPPKPTTFEKITFTMANGKSFVICPEDAIVDGYTLAWSDDAQDTITEF